MTGPVSPGASSRPKLSPAALQMVEAAIRLLDTGLGRGVVMKRLGCGTEIMRLAREARDQRNGEFAEIALRALPPPVLNPEQERRALRVARLRARLAVVPPGPHRSSLEHLCDLAEHHPTGYPSFRITSDGSVRGLSFIPFSLDGLGQSVAAACLDG